MKLKYYLRGLAVGILTATVILTAANAGSRPLSDAEIRRRAVELGMVDGESVKLPASISEEEIRKRAAELGMVDGVPDEAETMSGEETQDGRPADEQPGEETQDGQPADEQPGEETQDGQPADEQPGEETQDGQPADEQPGEGDPVIFEIKSGSTSYTVSRELAAAGLVADAAAFDAYLCDNGYARKVRSGTYQIIPGTSEEEIARLIAH